MPVSAKMVGGACLAKFTSSEARFSRVLAIPSQSIAESRLVFDFSGVLRAILMT